MLLGNVCNNDGHDIELYNNSSTPRGATAYNSIICNAVMGGNGLRNGSTGDGSSVTSSDNFFFNNTIVNANIYSENYGSQNYYSQNFMGNGSSLSTASGVQVFFNSPDVSGNLQIQDSSSGLDAIVQNAATTNGAPVITATTNNFGNNVWQLIPTDSGYCKIININSALALNVSGASTSAGAPIIQWSFGSGQNDQWMPMSAGNGLYNFTNRHSGLALDVTGASVTPGTQLDQQPFVSAANQEFNLIDAVSPPLPTAVNVVSWTSGGAPDGNWTTTANWGGVLPQSSDGLSFGAGSQILTTNDFPSNSIFENIFFTNGVPSFTLNGNGLTLTNPTETVAGNASGGGVDDASANAQTINLPLTFSAGHHIIQTETGAGQLNLHGTISRNIGTTAQFISSGGNINCTGSGLMNVNGILGGWAIDGNDFASLDNNSNSVAFNNYTSVTGSGAISPTSTTNNMKISGDTGNFTANNIVLNSLVSQITGGNRSLTITGALKLGAGGGASGGIYCNSSSTKTLTLVGSGTLTANGGGELTLASGSSSSFYTPPNANGATPYSLLINTTIGDDGANPLRLNTIGYIEMQNTNATYTGDTYINAGKILSDKATHTRPFGNVGAVHIAAGAQFMFWDAVSILPNNFYIAGSGPSAVDNSALRFMTSGQGISGTIALVAPTTVAGNNTANTISGKITGSGSLTIGAGNSSAQQANGNMQLTLNPPAANDYQGDTTIAANQTISGITSLIMGSGKNNIMPNGNAAGNLILAGGSGSLLAIFDLNGTTQNINGLIDTNGTVANAIVTNSANSTAANLILGNNDANSIFGGVIKNGAGSSAVALTKVGAGVETLSGNNTYTGNTIVSNGVLALGSAGSISSSAKITIKAGATLDASARADQTFTLNSGQTLQGNGMVNVNLTVGTNAIVMPGDSASLGTLNVASAAQLQGTTVMKLNAATGASDEINASSFIFGGTLTVTNVSGTLTPGQSFQLFLADVYSGSFSAINLPPPGDGLAWDTNNLATGGVVQVVPAAKPQFVGITVSGTSLVFSGSNGIPGWNYLVLATTNLALPVVQWPVVATNAFDSNGNFSFTNALDSGASRQFYLLKLQ